MKLLLYVKRLSQEWKCCCKLNRFPTCTRLLPHAEQVATGTRLLPCAKQVATGIRLLPYYCCNKLNMLQQAWKFLQHAKQVVTSTKLLLMINKLQQVLDCCCNRVATSIRPLLYAKQATTDTRPLPYFKRVATDKRMLPHAEHLPQKWDLYRLLLLRVTIITAYCNSA